jgi:hypothetical protein
LRRLEVFHFSPRYQGMAQAFHAEARAELMRETRLEDEEPWAADLLGDTEVAAVADGARAELHGDRRS